MAANEEASMRRRTFIAGAALTGAPGLLASARADDASVVERFAAALSAHDMSAFANLFADDYVNHQVSAAAPPAPPGVAAKAATVAFFTARLKAMPDLKVTIQASLAEGDKAAASFAYEGTNTGPYYGFDPTGKRLFFTSCDIFRIAGGKIVEHWGMGDIAGVVAQLKG